MDARRALNRLRDRQAAPRRPAGPTLDELDRPPFWERAIAWWDIVLALAVLATAGAALADHLGRHYWLLIAALVVIAALYAFAGRRELHGGPQRWAWCYLVPAWMIFLGAVQLTSTSQLLLFALFPQTWAMLPAAGAAITSIVAMAATLGIRVEAGDHPAVAAASAAINLGLSLLLGFWVNGIAVESERRRALALELRETRAELAESERSAGTLAERQRISQEIHDTLAQGFTSLLTLAQAAEAEIGHPADADTGDGDTRLRDRLQLMQRTARQNLDEARALVAELAPAELSATVLAAALHRAVRRCREEHRIPTSVEIVGTPRQLPRNADVVVLRTAQEALTNAGRHAAASEVSVVLQYRDEGGTTLTVRDDGRGLPDGMRDGFGLGGMRARAADIGATLSVSGCSDTGTTVHLELP